MKLEKIDLKKVFPSLEHSAEITAYIIDNSPEMGENRKHPTIVICPGGGYAMTSDREAEPIALKFNAAGYNAVVLRYSVAPVRYPNQLLQASAAIALVRRNAAEWNVDTQKVAICGFSAGGHLAASVGVLWQEEFIKDQLQLKAGENRPDAMILAYPVISGGEYAHRDSFNNLIGEDASKEMLDFVSLENRVTSNAPAAFIWHTATDAAVPCENSLMFASELQKNNISVEFHLYRNGCHGLSLCNKETSKDEHAHMGDKNPLINSHIATWFNLCLEWLDEIFA